MGASPGVGVTAKIALQLDLVPLKMTFSWTIC